MTRLLPLTVQPLRIIVIALLMSGLGQCAAQTPSPQHPQMQSAQNKTNPRAPKQSAGVSSEEVLSVTKAGDLKALRGLVAKGADVNVAGRQGETPLMLAVVAKKHKCVDWLLLHGADPNLQDYKNRSATSLAAGLFDDSESLAAILKHGGDPNIVQRTTTLSDGTIVHANTTPVYDAITARNVRNVELLIDAGADVNFRVDDHLMTPLGWSIATHRYDIAYVLIERGADYHARGVVPRMTIVECLKNADLSLIIEADEPDAVKRKQKEAELRKWYFRVVELLKERGVDIRRHDSLGATLPSDSR